MEQLGINLPGLIAQLVNFGLLVGLLYVVAYKPILSMLDNRAERIDRSLKEADEARKEAAVAKAAQSDQRAEAQRQVQEIIARANQNAERIHREAQERAKLAADEFLVKARAEIDRDRQRAVAEVRAEMADLAIFAASRVVRSSLGTPEHYRLVEEALAEAERAKLS